MDISTIESIIESLIFSYGDALSLDKICEILELDKKTVRSLMKNFMDNYNRANKGIIIREINDKYQMCSNPQYFDYVSKLYQIRQKQALSQAAYEVLSIIAYNQPITKAKIEQIRGVNSDSAVTRLLERNLVKEAGKLEAPGRPRLYETTDEFLKCFGFKSIRDLPMLDIQDLSELNLEELIEEDIK
ncbi:SMC-Scp complex subunit ScpB [Ruminiclostridium cellobioparum]|uniref:Segregation and condensation protein B n=1 Tax=Ruminiclostridium cellobioparum subsp. termitidis CT1112 TaxID=1195236 RepID=S0FLP9_RUMCE|nr:SMC-Scp complex subunit ScpB [Ruminiclostridium cellobioparum]EMS73160.1 segregation and condensation protein B [Ruminiclostridium cellobioparum subsp. termitidis CT1112]